MIKSQQFYLNHIELKHKEKTLNALLVVFVPQVLSSVPPQPPARPAHPSQLSVRLEHHLAAWTLQLLAGAGTEAAQDVPLPVLKAAVAINALLPPTIKPTGGHVRFHSCSFHFVCPTKENIVQYIDVIQMVALYIS